MDDKQSERKPMNHPDYRIPGTDVFNFSKWSRENDPKPPARYEEGDHVVLVIACTVTRVYKDCDGTALYSLDGTYHGFSDEAVLPGNDDDWEHDAMTLAALALSRAESEASDG